MEMVYATLTTPKKRESTKPNTIKKEVGVVSEIAECFKIPF
jgi:hypothetical protein